VKFTWSFSNLKAYEQCPKRYWHLKVQKDYREAESEVLLHGKAVHRALELRLSKREPLPLHLRHLEDLCSSIADMDSGGRSSDASVTTEVRLAINREFKPVAFFANDVWCRAVLDAVVTKGGAKALVIDWKTGARVDEDFTQLEVASAILLHTMEELDEATFRYIYTQVGASVGGTISREGLTGVWATVLPRVTRMERAFERSDFPARPCGLCRKYCPVTSCPHNGRV